MLLKPENLVSVSIVDYSYEVTDEGIALAGSISLAPQVPLPFTPTIRRNETDTEISSLVEDRNSIISAGLEAQARIDKVCATVCNANTPLPAPNKFGSMLRHFGSWVIGNQGRQLSLQLDDDSVEYEIPTMVDLVLDPEIRDISGFVGAIEVDHFVLYEVYDVHGSRVGEKPVRGKKAKIFFSAEQAQNGCLVWLASARTRKVSVQFYSRAYKKHYASRVSHYELFAGSNETLWKVTSDNLPRIDAF
jgi:hypothetical protein